MTVSAGQQKDSVVHIHVFVLPQTPLPSRLPRNSEQSFLCYTVGPCWLSTLNTALAVCSTCVYMSIPNPLNYGEKTAVVARWPLGPFIAALSSSNSALQWSKSLHTCLTCHPKGLPGSRIWGLSWYWSLCVYLTPSLNPHESWTQNISKSTTICGVFMYTQSQG